MQEQQLLNNTANYQKLFKSELGQEVYKDLLDRSGIELAACDLSHAHLAYNEGRKSLFLEIKSMIDANLSELKEILNNE